MWNTRRFFVKYLKFEHGLNFAIQTFLILGVCFSPNLPLRTLPNGNDCIVIKRYDIL